MQTDAPSMLSRRGVITALAGVVGGCGFHPVYGPVSSSDRGSGPAAGFAQIQVALVPERTGQLLRQALQQRLDLGEGRRKRFELGVSYSIAVSQVGYQQDTSITRLRLLGSGNWTLKDLDTGVVVTTGSSRSLDGLDILDQQYFAADIANETAQRRLAENVAEQITLQLAAYFSQHKVTD